MTTTKAKAGARAEAGNTTQQAPVVSTGPEESRRQLAVDDSTAHTTYASACLVNATAEEVIVDFVRHPSRAPDETSRVTTLPAPTMAPSPILTGATNAVFDPIKAPLPISVSALLKPS